MSLFMLIAPAVIACQCTGKPGDVAAALASDVVAVGRIATVARADRFSIGAVQIESAIVATMTSEMSWRASAPTLTIVGGFSDCDVDFAVGERYLVFAEHNIAGLGRREGMTWASRCLPTRRLEAKAFDGLQVLGEPRYQRPAAPEVTGPAERPVSVPFTIVAIAVMVAAVAAVTIFLARRAQ